jgi:hypothetical protein
LARVGSGFSAVSAATVIQLDTVAGSLFKSADFSFLADVIDMNLGELASGAAAIFPESLQVFINGLMLRPVIDSGKIKTFQDGTAVSFAGLQGDFVLYKNHSPSNGGLAFAFAIKSGDEIQVRYNNG